MREFRIKVNNEKTYVVKANDYNQAVKTLHSKLRDFDDTKKNINVVREFITNNGGKFSESKDADAILDFIYKKTGVKNADYGDVLYIIRNYTNVKVEDNTVTDFDLTNFLALKRSLELRIGKEIDFDKLEEYVNKLPKDKNGKKNVDVKEVIKCCIKAKDNSVSDSVSKYNGEDAIKTNGFVKIKEDGDWTSYKYNGSDFDDAVFKIHQYNPSLIAFVSNGNRTITVRNKYLKDSSIKDVSYVSGKNLKIGQKIVEDGKVLEVVDIKETQRGVNNNYRDVTFKNVKTGATETVHFGNSTLARLNDYSPKYNKGQKIQTSAGIHEIIGYDPVRADVHTNRTEYSYRLKTPNGTYTNIPDWQLEELVKLGRYKLIDSNISDKLIESGSKKALSKNIATEIKAGKDPKQAAAIAYSVQRENDASTGYKYRITNNGSKWYYETTFPDGHTTLTGPYLSRQETEQYFHKHRPTEKLTDAEPVKVEKIIRKEKSALGITYYLFQTKSSSGATIYYEVTDKSYHGEPTYSGGGVISFSLKTANDSLDSHLLSDKLKAKYGEKEGTKRFLSGENDSTIKDKLSTSDANSLVEAYIDKYKYTHSNLPYVNKPKIKIFNSPEEFRDKFLSSYRGYSIYAGGLLNYNGYVVKLFTSAKDGKIESPSADNIFTIFPTTAIKDSNNIKNRKSYTIKVGDKQYKVFAESESEAINKYIKSKKQ